MRMRFLASCASFSIGALYAITIGICFLFGTLFAWVLLPQLERKYRATEHLVQELMQKEQTVMQAEGDYAKMGTIGASKDRQWNVLMEPYTMLRGFETSRKILFTMHSDHGLQIISYEPLVLKDKEWYIKHGCTMVSKGTFQAILAFFNALARNKHVIACKHMNIVESSGNELLMTAHFTLLEIKGK